MASSVGKLRLAKKKIQNPLNYFGGALNVYETLINESVGCGFVKDGGAESRALPEDLCEVTEKHPELTYDMPSGRALVPRELYPVQFNKKGKKDQWVEFAATHKQHYAKNCSVSDWVLFLKQTKTAISVKLNSKAKYHVVSRAQARDIKYKGRRVETPFELRKRFSQEDLSLKECFHFCEVYIGTTDDERILCQVELEVLEECNFWYDKQRNGSNWSKDGEGYRIKTSFPISHFRKVVNNNHTKEIQREGKKNGLKLTITKVGGACTPRRKGMFDATNIVGWNGEKHKTWKKKLKKAEEQNKSFNDVSDDDESEAPQKKAEEQNKSLNDVSVDDKSVASPVRPAADIASNREPTSDGSRSHSDTSTEDDSVADLAEDESPRSTPQVRRAHAAPALLPLSLTHQLCLLDTE